ncbi:MAG: universal stress protein [Burkholderiales bacterium]
MRRVLLAVDGSATSDRAAQRVIDMRKDLVNPDNATLHLLQVQRPVSRDVSSLVGSQSLDEYYLERADAALASARALLDAAGVAHTDHRRVGDPGSTIANVASAEGCGLIVMGTRGLGSHTAALIGSVAQKTVVYATVPVLLVK